MIPAIMIPATVGKRSDLQMLLLRCAGPNGDLSTSNPYLRRSAAKLLSKDEASLPGLS
jgi:hypothetical protein